MITFLHERQGETRRNANAFLVLNAPETGLKQKNSGSTMRDPKFNTRSTPGNK